MTALAEDRDTRRGYHERTIYMPVAAATTIYAGAMVARDGDGRAVPAAKTTGLKVIGRADMAADNSAGAAAAISVRVSTGVFEWKNDTDAVTQADMGNPVYVVDDQTVADEGEGSQIVAGILDKLDSKTGLPWVRTIDIGAADLVSAIETVTTGAISLFTRTSLLSVTGIKAFTLAAGLYEGQRKTLIVSVSGASAAGTVTPAVFASGTSEAMSAVGDFLELEYHDADGWTRLQAGNWSEASTIETVASGAISLLTNTSLITCAGTQAYTLADGLFIGQRKLLYVTAATATPVGTVTPVTLLVGTTFHIGAADEFYELEWQATGWIILASRRSEGATETVTDGVISILTRLTVMTTSGAQAYSLADGLFVGQRKTIRCGATDNVGTITPASVVGYATLALDAVQEFVELRWNGAAWELLSSLCTIA